MYDFFYKKTEYLNKYTLALALLGVAAIITGVVFLCLPSIKAAKNVWENRPQKFRLVTILPEDCADCFDIYQVTDFIGEALDVKYSAKKEYGAASAKAELLIKTYNIKTLPTFILQGNIEKSKIGELFDEASVGFKDGKTFVYANNFPPFYNLEEKQVRGRFNITYLTDNSCAACYNIGLHDNALQNLVMTPSASSTIDISSVEGKKLMNDYKIHYAPTILIKGDTDAYQNFGNLWETVGTIEKDGTYIFREKGLNLMGVYKNLWTGALMNVTK